MAKLDEMNGTQMDKEALLDGKNGNDSIRVPQVKTDFKNWDEFHASVVRYHKETRPNDNRVIDLIQTFREFMSEDLIERLGGFMRLHPRFNTSAGWDEWVENLSRARSIRSVLLTNYPTEKVCALKTTEDITTPGFGYKRALWSTLDSMVCSGDISSADQRQMFWDSQSREERKELINILGVDFNPFEKVWREPDPIAQMLAEQRLSAKMEFYVIVEQLVYLEERRKYLMDLAKHGVTLNVIWVCASQIYAAVRRGSNEDASQNSTATKVVIVVAAVLKILAGIIMVLCLIAWLFLVFKNMWLRRRLQRKKLEIWNPKSA